MPYTRKGSSVSLWQATTKLPIFPPLENDIETEVCVIGGGIAGLTTAYLLSEEGKKVLLIEAKPLVQEKQVERQRIFFLPMSGITLLKTLLVLIIRF